MSSGPKKQDYEASPAERASAAVALAENKAFKQKYDPLLQKQRDASRTDDTGDVLRGRANADTMQTLAGKASYDRAASADSGGDSAQAYQAQLGIADQAGLKAKNTMQLGVLGTARGQAADATAGMGAAANMGASRVLTQAKAKQTKREALTGAVAQVGTSFVMQGAKNMQTKSADGKKSGGFLSPVNKDGGKVSGIADRLKFSNFTNTDPYN